MSTPARILAFAGRNGPLLLLGGVLLGFVFPPLARGARPLMDAAVFCFTLGAFLKVDMAGFRAEIAAAGPRRILLVLAWTTFGVPLSAFASIALLRPGPEFAQGLLLCTVAPPVGSAAAIAAMLGLSAPLALFASVAATLAAPAIMPWLASSLGGYESHLDPLAMMLRLLVIVGGACCGSWALRRFAGRFVADNPTAMTGIAVVALIVFAIGAMQGMQAYCQGAPEVVAVHLLVAFGVNAGLQALGAVLFWRWDRAAALTVGLVSGNRNIGLAWSAAGAGLPPLTEVYFAMSVLPIYTLPALTKRLLSLALKPARRPAAALVRTAPAAPLAVRNGSRAPR